MKKKILFLLGLGIAAVGTVLLVNSIKANSEQATKHYALTEEGIIEVDSYNAPSESIEEKLEVKKVEQKEYKYFDVDLSDNLQMHIFKICEQYDVEPELIIAIIEQESGCDASLVGDGGDSIGLMQIQPKWHEMRMFRLNCNDLYEPFQNTTVGIDLIAELQEKNPDKAWVLMAFNGGEEYANRRIKNGRISNYASDILERYEELKGESAEW